MVIRLTRDGRVVLDGQDDFRRFCISVPPDAAALDATALAPLVRLDGEAHAWVDPAAVRRLAVSPDAAWDRGFGGMVAYAAGRGWVDPLGMVRAHIEREPA